MTRRKVSPNPSVNFFPTRYLKVTPGQGGGGREGRVACVWGAGPPGPVIRAVLPALGGPSGGPRGPSPSFPHPWGLCKRSDEGQTANLGPLRKKKKKRQKEEGAAVSVLGIQLRLVRNHFSRTAGSPSRSSRFPVTRVQGGGVSAGPLRRRSQACAAA